MKPLEEYTAVEIATVCFGMLIRVKDSRGIKFTIASVEEQMKPRAYPALHLDYKDTNGNPAMSMYLLGQYYDVYKADKLALETKLDTYFNKAPIYSQPRLDLID